MRLPRSHLRDAIFLLGVAAVISLSIGVGFALYRELGAMAAAMDVGVSVMFAGKTLGRGMGLRYSFWQSNLSVMEWTVVIGIVLYLNQLALVPAVQSNCVGRRHQPEQRMPSHR